MNSFDVMRWVIWIGETACFLGYIAIALALLAKIFWTDPNSEKNNDPQPEKSIIEEHEERIKKLEESVGLCRACMDKPIEVADRKDDQK